MADSSISNPFGAPSDGPVLGGVKHEEDASADDQNDYNFNKLCSPGEALNATGLQKPQPAAPFDTDAEKVLAIIDLQAFDGSWDPKEKKVPAFLGFKVPKAPNVVEGKVWVTVLVIAFLEMKMAGEEGMWGLVVEKARGYVQSVVEDGIEELKNMAGEVVGKN
jgi:hypothetical protein